MDILKFKWPLRVEYNRLFFRNFLYNSFRETYYHQPKLFRGHDILFLRHEILFLRYEKLFCEDKIKKIRFLGSNVITSPRNKTIKNIKYHCPKPATVDYVVVQMIIDSMSHLKFYVSLMVAIIKVYNKMTWLYGIENARRIHNIIAIW